MRLANIKPTDDMINNAVQMTLNAIFQTLENEYFTVIEALSSLNPDPEDLLLDIQN